MADNSAPPQTVNTYATALNRILAGLIEGAAEGEVEALIYAAFPTVFAIPVIGWIAKQVVDFFVSKFGTFFYQVAGKAAAQVVIKIQADSENSNVKSGAGKLQDAIESGDKDAIAKADQELEDDWGSLIHSDGAAPP